MKLSLFAAAMLVVALAVWHSGMVAMSTHQASPGALRLLVSSEHLPADGWTTATITIQKPPYSVSGIPQIRMSDTHGLTVDDIEEQPSCWLVQVHTGVLVGEITLTASMDRSSGATTLHLDPISTDEYEDGTPDFLRLDGEADRRAFRNWFTLLAEQQYFLPSKLRSKEVVDCAALARYAYHEALRSHDSQWAAGSQLFLLLAMASVQKYSVPYTPLRAALFRTTSGPFTSADITSGSFTQFADAKTLRQFNTYRVSRNIKSAQPADLFFFREPDDTATYHTMIVIGKSLVTHDAKDYVVYHTGPTQRSSGEMRRLALEELMSYPESRWRPIESNQNFLGVFRWNILR